MDSLEKHFPIPVVRLILRNQDGRVLILRRANTRYAPGEWCLPGGKVDYGRTVEQAVVQELQEETSLICTASRFLFYQDSLPATPGEMQVLNLYFECDWAGEIRLNEESSEYAWVGPKDYERFALRFNNDAGLKRYFFALAEF